MVNLTADRSVDEQVAEFPLKLNPYRECIAGQLKADLWGYLAPSDPREGARHIHHGEAPPSATNGWTRAGSPH